MTDAERLWRDKSDDDLLEAAAELSEYTDEGQRIIRAELKRRGLEDPVEQAGIDTASAGAGEAFEPECLRCRVPLQIADPDDPDAADRWSWLGSLWASPLRRGGLDVYICPRCGHVELFADVPDRSETEQETDVPEEPPAGAGAWGQG